MVVCSLRCSRRSTSLFPTSFNTGCGRSAACTAETPSDTVSWRPNQVQQGWQACCWGQTAYFYYVCKFSYNFSAMKPNTIQVWFHAVFEGSGRNLRPNWLGGGGEFLDLTVSSASWRIFCSLNAQKCVFRPELVWRADSITTDPYSWWEGTRYPLSTGCPFPKTSPSSRPWSFGLAFRPFGPGSWCDSCSSGGDRRPRPTVCKML